MGIMENNVETTTILGLGRNLSYACKQKRMYSSDAAAI